MLLESEDRLVWLCNSIRRCLNIVLVVKCYVVVYERRDLLPRSNQKKEETIQTKNDFLIAFHNDPSIDLLPFIAIK